MYWNEDDNENKIPEVVDVVFKIDCKMLHVDHAWALSEALAKEAPWILEEELFGLHPVHISESANGWQRPDDENAEIHLSKRAHFGIRIPKSRIDDAKELSGLMLNINGHSMKLGKTSIKELVPLPTIHSRYILSNKQDTEDEFIEYVASEIQKHEIPLRKLMCGKSSELKIDGKKHFFRSIMVADLNKEHSLLLQHTGIGPHRKMGSGLFIPHKGIASIAKVTEE